MITWAVRGETNEFAVQKYGLWLIALSSAKTVALA